MLFWQYNGKTRIVSFICVYYSAVRVKQTSLVTKYALHFYRSKGDFQMLFNFDANIAIQRLHTVTKPSKTVPLNQFNNVTFCFTAFLRGQS